MPKSPYVFIKFDQLFMSLPGHKVTGSIPVRGMNPTGTSAAIAQLGERKTEDLMERLFFGSFHIFFNERCPTDVDYLLVYETCGA
jgi:hypothetical protein